MITQKGILINVGDQVTYLTKEIKAENYHKSSTTKTGIVEEVFKSMDGLFLCFWIKDEHDLITEFQLQ